MILGTGCLADQALDGEAIRRALEVLRLDRVLLVARDGSQPRALAGLAVSGVRAAWVDRELGVDVARRTRAPRLVLGPPAGAGVEATARAMFALARSQPGLALALATPDDGALADPQQLGLVLDDLVGLPLGYWHRPSRALLSGHPDVAWIDRLGRHLVGMSLDDVAGGEPGLPPGTGELDLSPAASLAGRSLDVALDTEPLPDVTLLRVALQTLRAAGFP